MLTPDIIEFDDPPPADTVWYDPVAVRVVAEPAAPDVDYVCVVAEAAVVGPTISLNIRTRDQLNRLIEGLNWAAAKAWPKEKS